MVEALLKEVVSAGRTEIILAATFQSEYIFLKS